MKRLALSGLCLAAAALAGGGGVARGEGDGREAAAVVFPIKPKHGSRTTGTATLTAAGNGIRVALKIKTPVRGSLPAHIHTGPCKREPTFANPRIFISLTNVARGRSVTTSTSATLDKLRAKPFSINVHAPTYDVIACGDIPRG
jgi:hypothetical protein